MNKGNNGFLGCFLLPIDGGLKPFIYNTNFYRHRGNSWQHYQEIKGELGEKVAVFLLEYLAEDSIIWAEIRDGSDRRNVAEGNAYDIEGESAIYEVKTLTAKYTQWPRAKTIAFNNMEVLKSRPARYIFVICDRLKDFGYWDTLAVVRGVYMTENAPLLDSKAKNTYWGRRSIERKTKPFYVPYCAFTEGDLKEIGREHFTRYINDNRPHMSANRFNNFINGLHHRQEFI